MFHNSFISMSEVEKVYGIYIVTRQILKLQFRLTKKGIALLDN